ncbi:MAG: GDP-L-fucose synthase [Rhodobacteraceae bacterium]|nr:GDP-L-fucose synthase [Paracoccaceae bacterium]
MKRVFVAGHGGMVGRALVRRLTGVELVTRPRAALDLTDSAAVARFFKDAAIDEVYLAAAKVGGIEANSRFPADFIYENMMIEANVIHGAHLAGVQKLLFLGSSCIYPRDATQPIREEALLTGPLEPSNAPYAVAKIAGIKLCESYNRQYGHDYRAVMPTNLYGPYDNFHLENSHVIPALLRRFHAAGEEMVIWGSGQPRREFLHVDDMAAACVFVMGLPAKVFQAGGSPDCAHINIGTGADTTIRGLAEMMAEVTGYRGRLVFDTSRPDGTPRKLLDVSKLSALGWRASIGLREGLLQAYEWFVTHQDGFRGQKNG